ncbi:MAG TPA: chorismate synthase [Saprospiraceae bacterium]|nr:chorismate synthase [Saprospiraceae bacterium]
MAGNTYGNNLKITTFGESHGRAVGVVIDGFPAGIMVHIPKIQEALDRRRPGQSHITTQRKETDQIEVLSGIFEGKSTGMPITLAVFNHDARSKDYSHIKDAYRPSHADFTYEVKYGHRDYRGGGRSSARETLARVAAGALIQQWLAPKGVSIQAYVNQIGHLKVPLPYTELDLSLTEKNIVRCPDAPLAQKMITLVEQTKKAGDSVGGMITCVISGLPAGLGEPVFDKLHAELAKATLSINACKGFDYGSGFDAVSMRGSEHNDEFVPGDPNPQTKTNHSGGIQGGISNGMDIYFRAAFKPVATIMHDQQSVDKFGNPITVKGKGRHDPCVVPRAVPIVEAMAWLVIGDFWLRAGKNPN